jgi:hypothetical protein
LMQRNLWYLRLTTTTFMSKCFPSPFLLSMKSICLCCHCSWKLNVVASLQTSLKECLRSALFIQVHQRLVFVLLFSLTTNWRMVIYCYTT